jgi:hypothetical protein
MARAQPAAWRVLIYSVRYLGLMSITGEDLAEIAAACPLWPKGMFRMPKDWRPTTWNMELRWIQPDREGSLAGEFAGESYE